MSTEEEGTTPVPPTDPVSEPGIELSETVEVSPPDDATHTPVTDESPEDTIRGEDVKEPVNSAEEVLTPDPYITRKTTPNPSVTLTDPVMKVFDTSKRNFPLERLSVLMADPEELNARTQGWSRNEWGTDRDTLQWVGNLAQGVDHLTEQRPFLDMLKKPDPDYMQTIDAGGMRLGSALARVGESNDGNTKLTGEAAAIRMQMALGLGALVQVPLWHTGIWVTLKAPSERELLMLEYALTAEKTELGRDTTGRVFSAQGVYAVSAVVDFVLNHVYTTSAPDSKPEELKKLVLLTDLHLLILGMLSAMYPSGYPLSRVCVADPDRCKHVTSELVAIAKLLFVSRRALSDKQLAHMRRRSAKFTLEEIKAYQAEHQYAKLPSIKINERVTVNLRVPTLGDYELNGRIWLDEIQTLVDQAVGAGVTEQERNLKIKELALTQATRQYGHWVNDVVIDGTGVISDEQEIRNTITSISGNDEYEAAFYTGVVKWITECSIALVAIPNYNCPACGKDQVPDPELAQHPHLIALDTVSTFFTLLAQKVARIRSRQMG